MADYQELKERLLKNSKINGECVESTYKSVNRYAHVKFNKKMISTHKASWLVHFGEIPKGLWVLHKCDNPLCINPNHLFLGTPLDNSRDMQKKGRQNYLSRTIHSNELALKAIELRKNGMIHKDIANQLEISMGSLNSIFRRNSLKDEVKEFYCVSKYSKEIIQKAHELKDSGMKCKDIQVILNIPKRTLSRIFNQEYKRVYNNH